MEIVCIDKKAFDEICSHFNEFEDRVNRLCRPNQDLGLKNWMDNQDVSDTPHLETNTASVPREGLDTVCTHKAQDILQTRGYSEIH